MLPLFLRNINWSNLALIISLAVMQLSCNWGSEISLCSSSRYSIYKQKLPGIYIATISNSHSIYLSIYITVDDNENVNFNLIDEHDGHKSSIIDQALNTTKIGSDYFVEFYNSKDKIYYSAKYEIREDLLLIYLLNYDYLEEHYKINSSNKYREILSNNMHNDLLFGNPVIFRKISEPLPVQRKPVSDIWTSTLDFYLNNPEMLEMLNSVGTIVGDLHKFGANIGLDGEDKSKLYGYDKFWKPVYNPSESLKYDKWGKPIN